MKRWKVAISLAVVAALVGPLVTGTWKPRPGGWHPLPVDERTRIAKMAAETDNCTHFSPQDTELGKTICMILLSDLHAGGRYENGERITWRYVAKNFELMAAAFFFVFLAAMILPALGARYWHGWSDSRPSGQPPPAASLLPSRVGYAWITWGSMKTSAEYLALSQRYRIAKLSTRDDTVRHQLEVFERSYFILSKTAQTLARFKAALRRTSQPPFHTHNAL